ncbi:MAG TPA: protease inhibitor I9 family protein [Longimicrobium sp.]|jgi:hypothetical protein|uniref:protease inhibitor I9 family protein n=1 Tax=Longimicrobium sp. TaxID=2029185 RepID=UPI002ED81D1E
MRKRSFLAPLALLALAACDSPTGPDARAQLSARCSNAAPVLSQPDPSLANLYIVVYREGTDSRATTARLAQTHGFTPRFVYEHALLGFSAELSADALAGVRCEPEVKYVEGDKVVRVGV